MNLEKGHDLIYGDLTNEMSYDSGKDMSDAFI